MLPASTMTKRVVLGTAGAATILLGSSKRAREESRLQLNAVVRFTRCAWAAAMVGVDYSQLEKRCENLDRLALKQEYSKTHLRAAERMLHVCRSNGGIFNKLGQYVSTMNNVLPQEYTRTLSVIQDQAPYQEPHEIRRVLVHEFGKAPEELFSHFEEVPIASASLAQVHRARTKEGKDVAVKVQYPLLRKQIEKDLSTVNFLMQMLAYFFPDMEYTWMLPDFADNLRNELNFVQEGLNATRVSSLLTGEHGRLGVEDESLRKSDKIHIPDVYWELTTARVLTMEFIDGIKVTDVDSLRTLGIDPVEVGTLVSRLFAELVHVHGLVHCDPHPGNIFVRRKPGSPLLPYATKEEIDDKCKNLPKVNKLVSIDSTNAAKSISDLSSGEKMVKAFTESADVAAYCAKVIAVVPVLLSLGIGAATAAAMKEAKRAHKKFQNRNKTADELENERKQRLREEMMAREKESNKREENKRKALEKRAPEIASSGSATSPSEPTSTTSTCGESIYLSHNLPSNDDWQVVLIDHGMYRRLDSSFRKAYSLLWKALLLRDKTMGLGALEGMNVPKTHIEMYYELLSLIFTFKPSDSTATRGQRMTQQDKQKLKDMFYENPFDAGDISKFLESLPRDILFAMRGTAILRSINSSLGGTSAERFSITVEAATRALYIPDSTQIDKKAPGDLELMIKLNDYVPEQFTRGLLPSVSSMNIPTDTEKLLLPRFQPLLNDDLMIFPSVSTWSYLALGTEITSVRFKVWMIDTIVHLAKWQTKDSHDPHDSKEWG